MLVTAVLSMLYLLVAAFAAVMTYLERRATGEGGLVYTTLGFTACFVWPLTFLMVVIAVAARPTTSTY